MKSLQRLFLSAAAGVLALSLAGCAMPLAQKQGQEHEQHHSRSSSPKATKQDMAEMCHMHDQMMSERNPQERHAMMKEHLKSMPPETVQRHMNMMQKKMTMMQEDMQMMREHMGQRMTDK